MAEASRRRDMVWATCQHTLGFAAAALTSCRLVGRHALRLQPLLEDVDHLAAHLRGPSEAAGHSGLHCEDRGVRCAATAR
eukprot:6642082-Prymnesium_polylepis.1